MTERIDLQDTIIDVITKLSEGNPGALRVCMDILMQDATIDPDNALSGIGPLLSLDTHGIYGSRIWMLYKDVCGEDMVNTLGVLRGRQLGYISDAELNHAIDNRGNGVDVDAILDQVRECLPNFGVMPAELE